MNRPLSNTLLGLAAAIGLLAGWILFDSVWFEAGTGAYADTLATRLAYAADESAWRQATNGEPIPDVSSLRHEMDGYFGIRANQIVVKSLVGLGLGATGCVAGAIALRRRVCAAAVSMPPEESVL